MSQWALSNFFTCLTTFSLGIFVFFSNRKSRVNRIFCFYSLSISEWSFFTALHALTASQSVSLFSAKMMHLGVPLIPVLFFHFCLVILNSYDKHKKKLFIGYFISAIFIIVNFTSDFIVLGVRPKLGYYYFMDGGLLYPLLILSFVVYTVLGLYFLLRACLSSTGNRKNQLKYFFGGSLLGYTFGISCFLPVYNVTIFPYPFGSYAISLYVVMTTYAIVKYRLMDINIFLTRAGIFAFVYILVLGIPFWIGFNFLGKGLWILPVSIMAVFATAGPFIYQRLRRHAEDALLRDQRRYQNVLRQLSGTMTLIKDLDRLLKIIVYRTAKAVKVNFACVYLADDANNRFVQRNPYTKIGFFPGLPKELPYNSAVVSFIKEKHDPIFAEELTGGIRKEFNLRSGLIVPSFVRERLLGLLLLGPKSSGAIYTQDDVNAFEVLANQASLAIENTEFIADFQRTQSRLFATERMTSLGTMAGGMSHQLNNRFHAIVMATADTIDTLKFIDTSSCSQEVKEYLEQLKHALTRVQENAKLGGKIVNNFLNFAQPDRIQKEAKSFSLREPLEQAIEMVRIKTSLSEDMLERDIQEDLPQIQGDFVLLQDVFFNLIDNATDALSRKDKAIKNKELPGPSGYKGKIVIRMFKSDSSISVQIQDNGIGMPEEIRKHLFVPFFTTKATSSKGTGLGLFVIQKIIDVHQGQIQVSSEYGQGTTFTINLPINK